MIAEDTATLIVYLPKSSRAQIQADADREGTTASAIGRRVLIKEYPPKKGRK